MLASPVLAELSAPDVLNRTQEWLDRGELAQIVMTVRHHREACREAFLLSLERQKVKPNSATEKWLNAMARAFRLEGMGRPNGLLEREGILWPITRWRGTLFEADGAMGEYDLHGVWDQ